MTIAETKPLSFDKAILKISQLRSAVKELETAAQTANTQATRDLLNKTHGEFLASASRRDSLLREAEQLKEAIANLTEQLPSLQDSRDLRIAKSHEVECARLAESHRLEVAWLRRMFSDMLIHFANLEEIEAEYETHRENYVGLKQRVQRRTQPNYHQEHELPPQAKIVRSSRLRKAVASALSNPDYKTREMEHFDSVCEGHD